MTVRRALARSALAGGFAVALSLPLAMGAAAQADPKGQHIDLTCGGTTYHVVVAGNGQWTPAHDTASQIVFIPHTFVGFHGETFDTSGTLVDVFDDPTIQVQGSGKQRNDVSCTFRFVDVSDGSDPTFPAGYTFVGTGGVTGQVAGHA